MLMLIGGFEVQLRNILLFAENSIIFQMRVRVVFGFVVRAFIL